MLAMGRSLSLVSALVALTVFVIMVSRNTVSSPVDIDATRLYEEESGASPKQAHKQIRLIRNTRIDNSFGSYGGYEDSSAYNLSDDILNGSGSRDPPRKKVILSDCHKGTLYQQHNVSIDVSRSSSVETDIQLLIDDSYCIACVSVKAQNGININLNTDGRPGGRNTFTLKVTSSSCEYNERVQIAIKIYVTRKWGYRCDPI